MSVPVATKNRYEMLGNDPPEDEQPSKAPRQVIKNATTSKKRDEKPAPEDEGAGAGAGARGGRRGGRGGFTGNDAAFLDPEAGRDSNLSKATNDDANSSYPRGGPPRRGGGRRGREFDRHSATGKDEHEKQAEHGWGSNKGESEWNDELAGQELAQKDAVGVDYADPIAATPEADAEADAAAAATAAAEEEEKTKTYDEYLAELAARQANLGPPAAARRANEGTREDKKWANAKPLEKEGGEDYFAGDAKDKTRTRERKTKNLLDFEHRPFEPRDRRAGGERGRGGRGRGDGGPRSGRDRGPRGGHPSGGRYTGAVNVKDESAFPALGT